MELDKLILLRRFGFRLESISVSDTSGQKGVKNNRKTKAESKFVKHSVCLIEIGPRPTGWEILIQKIFPDQQWFANTMVWNQWRPRGLIAQTNDFEWMKEEIKWIIVDLLPLQFERDQIHGLAWVLTRLRDCGIKIWICFRTAILRTHKQFYLSKLVTLR